MAAIIALAVMATRFISLSDVILNEIERMGLQKEMSLYYLSCLWEEIVGPQIALHTAPETLRFDTLYLSVDSAPWMNQLTFFKKEIIKNVNNFLQKKGCDPRDQIREVFFRLAPRTTPYPEKMVVAEIANQNGPMMKEEVIALQNALSLLEDTEIKKKIATAMTGYFQKVPSS